MNPEDRQLWKRLAEEARASEVVVDFSDLVGESAVWSKVERRVILRRDTNFAVSTLDSAAIGTSESAVDSSRAMSLDRSLPSKFGGDSKLGHFCPRDGSDMSVEVKQA